MKKTFKKQRQKKLLNNKRVAILLCDGFEEIEMTSPYEALVYVGAKVDLIAPEGKTVTGWRHDRWGKTFNVDVNLAHAKFSQYDALILPGGVINSDKLRTYKRAISVIKRFLLSTKPLAVICHAPWSLIETKFIHGRTLTAYHSIKRDLINAGAKWKNAKVVIDGNLITSRNPHDLPAFNKAIINALHI